MNNNMTITLQLANEILAYLGRQPYEQVFQLIQKMQDEHKAFMDSMKSPLDENGQPMMGTEVVAQPVDQ